MKRFNFIHSIILLTALTFFSANFNLHAKRLSPIKFYTDIKEKKIKAKEETIRKKIKEGKIKIEEPVESVLKKKAKLTLAEEASTMASALKQWIRSKKIKADIGMTEDERKKELEKQMPARQIKEISDESEEIKGRLKPMTELEEKIKRNEKDLEKYSKRKEELEDEVETAKKEAEKKSEEYKQWISKAAESKTELSENIDAVKKYLDASGSGKEALTDFIDTLRWSDSSVKDDFSERVRIFIIEDPLETNIERMKKQLDSSSIHLGVNNFIDESGESKSKELKEIERKVGLLKSELSKLTKEIDIRQEDVSKDMKVLDLVSKDPRVGVDRKRLEYNQKIIKEMQALQAGIKVESEGLKEKQTEKKQQKEREQAEKKRREREEKERVLKGFDLAELLEVQKLISYKKELERDQKELEKHQEALKVATDKDEKKGLKFEIHRDKKGIRRLKKDIKTQKKEIEKITKEAEKREDKEAEELKEEFKKEIDTFGIEKAESWLEKVDDVAIATKLINRIEDLKKEEERVREREEKQLKKAETETPGDVAAIEKLQGGIETVRAEEEMLRKDIEKISSAIRLKEEKPSFEEDPEKRKGLRRKEIEESFKKFIEEFGSKQARKLGKKYTAQEAFQRALDLQKKKLKAESIGEEKENIRRRIRALEDELEFLRKSPEERLKSEKMFKEIEEKFKAVDKEIGDSIKSEESASAAMSKMFSELTVKEAEILPTTKELFEGDEYKKLEDAHKESNEELKKLVISKKVDEMEFDEVAMRWAKGLTLEEAKGELKRTSDFDKSQRKTIRKLLKEEIEKKNERAKEITKTKSLEGVVKELEKLNKKPVKTFNDWEEIRRLRNNAEEEIKRIDENATKEAEKRAKERMAVIEQGRKERRDELIAEFKKNKVPKKEIRVFVKAGQELQKQNRKLETARGKVEELKRERESLEKSLNDVDSRRKTLTSDLEEAKQVVKDKNNPTPEETAKIDKIIDEQNKINEEDKRLEREYALAGEQLRDFEAELKPIVKTQQKAKGEYTKQENNLKELLPKELKEENIENSLPITEKAQEKQKELLFKKYKRVVLAGLGLQALQLGLGAGVLGGAGIGIGFAVSGEGEAAGTGGEADFGVPEIEPYNFADYDFEAFYESFTG